MIDASSFLLAKQRVEEGIKCIAECSSTESFLPETSDDANSCDEHDLLELSALHIELNKKKRKPHPPRRQTKDDVRITGMPPRGGYNPEPRSVDSGDDDDVFGPFVGAKKTSHRRLIHPRKLQKGGAPHSPRAVFSKLKSSYHRHHDEGAASRLRTSSTTTPLPQPQASSSSQTPSLRSSPSSLSSSYGSLGCHPDDGPMPSTPPSHFTTTKLHFDDDDDDDDSDDYHFYQTSNHDTFDHRRHLSSTPSVELSINPILEFTADALEVASTMLATKRLIGVDEDEMEEFYDMCVELKSSRDRLICERVSLSLQRARPMLLSTPQQHQRNRAFALGKRPFVVYASEGGTAKCFAEITADRLDIPFIDMSTLSLGDMRNATIVYLVSTRGIGRPPPSVEEFFSSLLLSKEDIGGRFTIGALGDTTFHFPYQFGKDLEQALLERGSTPIPIHTTESPRPLHHPHSRKEQHSTSTIACFDDNPGILPDQRETFEEWLDHLEAKWPSVISADES